MCGNDDERRPVAERDRPRAVRSRYSASMRSTRASCPTWSKPTSKRLGCHSGTASGSSRRSPLSGPGKPPPGRRAVRVCLVAAERRTASDHRDVLRSRRLDCHFGEPRRRGLAQSGQRLSRRRLGSGDANGRTRREEARGRADGVVRIPDRAGERCRARGSRRARHPAIARRTEPQQCGLGSPGACRPHRRRDRGGRGRSGRRNLRRRAQYRRAGAGACRAGISPDHGRAFSVRSPACSSPRIAASMRSKARPSRRRSSHRARERRRPARRRKGR